MKFERGKSPKDAMGIGIKESIKNMGGLVLERDKDFYWSADRGENTITVGTERAYKATIIVVFEKLSKVDMLK